MIISALGVMILLLITAGAVRATMPALQFEEPLSVSPKVAPATALTEPVKSTPIAPSVSGFSVIEESSVPEPQPLSEHSTISMMLIVSIMSPSPIRAEATTALVVDEPPAAKPRTKAQTKRKLASQKPPELSWWQQLPWIRVR